ncbi:hypothetical protein [Fenollaria massiliensis]|uniref:CopG-like ribbon-helix-helix domain-containing protein n=1 Tax=Fenollaria massiliensis TaxID=938288 RepID=A0A9E7IVB6_9FIRM|nr:hypothetical protein [Fenollaria massiliensis]UQK59543.1 hypothetical protein M1R53_02550 [Fenollaria massiliensis]
MAYVKKNNMVRSERIMFRCPKEFKEKLEMLSREDNRSLSEFVLVSLMKYFKEKEAVNND